LSNIMWSKRDGRTRTKLQDNSVQ